MAQQPGNAWGEIGPEHAWSQPASPPPPEPAHVGLADLLDGAFRLVRQRLLTLLVPTLLAVTVLTVLDVLLLVPVGAWLADASGLGGLDADTLAARPGRGSAEEAAFLAGVAEVATRVVLLAGTLLVSGLLAPALLPGPDADQLGPRGLLRRVRPRLGALVVTTLAVAGVVLLLVVLGALPGLVLMGFGGELPRLVGAVLAGLGGFAGFVVALLWWGVRLSLAPQAVVLEGLGARTALGRSVALVRGRYWRVLGVLAVATVLTWVVQGIVSAPFVTVGALVASSQGDASLAALGLTPWQLAVSGLGAIVSATAAFPLLSAVLTLLFDDLRSPGQLTPRISR